MTEYGSNLLILKVIKLDAEIATFLLVRYVDAICIKH